MTTFLELLPRFTTPALCASEGNPEQWHPPSGPDGVEIAKKAKAVCRRCPALMQCRTYAISVPSLTGVWGALSDGERATARREAPKPKRQRTHCAKGHEYTPENTRQDANGRRCRTCHNAADRAKRARNAS